MNVFQSAPRLFGVLFACIVIGLPVAACVSKATTPVVLNSNGTPANTAEKIAGDAYVSYIAVDTAYLTALKAGAVPKAAIPGIEADRKAARSALDNFAEASVSGDAAAAQAAFTEAEAAYISALGNAGVKTN